jgi:hypothetical protein
MAVCLERARPRTGRHSIALWAIWRRRAAWKFAKMANGSPNLPRSNAKVLVQLWSDERNLTRRVLCVKECAEDRIVLEVQRFGRTKPSRLEFLRTDSPRAAGRITPEQFRARFERILKERFPDAVVDSLTAAPDLEHSFSGLYVRGMMREGSRAWVLLAAASSEDAAAVEGARQPILSRKSARCFPQRQKQSNCA